MGCLERVSVSISERNLAINAFCASFKTEGVKFVGKRFGDRDRRVVEEDFECSRLEEFAVFIDPVGKAAVVIAFPATAAVELNKALSAAGTVTAVAEVSISAADSRASVAVKPVVAEVIATSVG
mmetsp:Transcript_47395/g.93232  ORF Transcript_47395/g.93232 Transcript_47395/m.93232 type:complete len:124 (-) Transcript_47395:779-1150(-)